MYWKCPREVSVGGPSRVQLLVGRSMLLLRRTLKLAPGVLVKKNWNGPLNGFCGLVKKIGVLASCVSNAPMSLASPPLALEIPGKSTGRGKPRWSVLAAREGITLRFPLSMAGLLVKRAWVKVGPPLFCHGPSFGSVLIWSVESVRKPPPLSLLTL